MQYLIPEYLLAQAQNIKALVFDVDGVLTDGKIIYDNHGNELKEFQVKDGLIIKLLLKAGYTVGAITGRESEVVKHRCEELGLSFHYHGSKNKREHLESVLANFGLQPAQVAYIGDDWPDLPAFEICGLKVCPADANHFIKHKADWILHAKGGEGAIREMAEGILHAKGELENMIATFLAQ